MLVINTKVFEVSLGKLQVSDVYLRVHYAQITQPNCILMSCIYIEFNKKATATAVA